MIQLPNSLQAWNSANFESVFKREIKQLDDESLPLQQCLSHGSYTNARNLDIIILTTGIDDRHIHIKTGIFFQSQIPGCACEDDPTPESEYTEYCVLNFTIDKLTANTHIDIIHDA